MTSPRFDDLAQVAMERDAAIRERDEAKQHHARECEKCSALADKVISLRSRIAELEAAQAAIGVSNSQPISGDGKSAVEETQAAKVAAGTEPVSSDPFAWAVMSSADPPHRVGLHWDQELADRWARAKQSEYTTKLVIVPLYAAPQPAPGWLTAEEREAVTLAAQQAPESDFVTTVEGKWINKTLTDLLARSTPPEVVLEDFTPDAICNLHPLYLHGWNQCIALAKKGPRRRWRDGEGGVEVSEDTKMWDTLQCLPDAVAHMIHGDPDDADSVKASDAVKWAIAQIARLREERMTNEERGAISWATAALLHDADITAKRGMAQRSQHSCEAAETLKRLLERMPLVPETEGAES